MASQMSHRTNTADVVLPGSGGSSPPPLRQQLGSATTTATTTEATSPPSLSRPINARDEHEDPQSEGIHSHTRINRHRPPNAVEGETADLGGTGMDNVIQASSGSFTERGEQGSHGSSQPHPSPRSPHSGSAMHAEAGAAASSGPTCRIVARQWNAVATWSWSVQTDDCAVCKNSLADVCVECQMKGPSVPPPHQQGETVHQTASSWDQCTIAWGCCSHVFHSHCILRWLTERKVCPLCGRPWELYKITKND